MLVMLPDSHQPVQHLFGQLAFTPLELSPINFRPRFSTWMTPHRKKGYKNSGVAFLLFFFFFKAIVTVGLFTC